MHTQYTEKGDERKGGMLKDDQMSHSIIGHHIIKYKKRDKSRTFPLASRDVVCLMRPCFFFFLSESTDFYDLGVNVKTFQLSMK